MRIRGVPPVNGTAAMADDCVVTTPNNTVRLPGRTSTSKWDSFAPGFVNASNALFCRDSRATAVLITLPTPTFIVARMVPLSAHEPADAPGRTGAIRCGAPPDIGTL